MTTGQLKGYLQTDWSRIKEELLNGTNTKSYANWLGRMHLTHLQKLYQVLFFINIRGISSFQ